MYGCRRLVDAVETALKAHPFRFPPAGGQVTIYVEAYTL
jgi:hypothetical protein